MKTVIEMAREAGFVENRGNVYGGHQELERFAALVSQRTLAGSYPEMIAIVAAAAKAEEREACAKWYDTTGHTLMRHEVPDAIRARSNT